MNKELDDCQLTLTTSLLLQSDSAADPSQEGSLETPVVPLQLPLDAAKAPQHQRQKSNFLRYVDGD